jgi:hypothetical protein
MVIGSSVNKRIFVSAALSHTCLNTDWLVYQGHSGCRHTWIKKTAHSWLAGTYPDNNTVHCSDESNPGFDRKITSSGKSTGWNESWPCRGSWSIANDD